VSVDDLDSVKGAEAALFCTRGQRYQETGSNDQNGGRAGSQAIAIRESEMCSGRKAVRSIRDQARIFLRRATGGVFRKRPLRLKRRAAEISLGFREP